MSKQPVNNHSLTYVLSDEAYEHLHDNIDLLRFIVDCASSSGGCRDITINANAFCTSLGKIEDSLRNIVDSLSKVKVV